MHNVVAIAFGLVLLATPALADEPAGWPYYGGDQAGTRYSTADQITPDNVDDLDVAWIYHTGEIERRGAELVERSSSQMTPVIVGDHLIICTPFNRIVALDPATGEERWVFDPEIDLTLQLPHFNCRGVTQWTDPDAPGDALCAHRILFGTNDARMMAIDARNGKRCTGFGKNGEVHIPQAVASIMTGEWRVTSAPVIAGGNVITGIIILDNLRADAPRGTVHAFDVRTGALSWTFDPIPRDPADPAYHTWQDGSAETSGAANVWSTMVADVERDLVFLPTSSAAPDHWGGERKGDNRYSSSLVALKASTGEMVWHYQLVHHDIWDYDVSSPPMLVDLEKDGRVIPAVVQNTKQGFVFVFDRETGEPVFPIEERPVPQFKLEGEWLSPTQPFPQESLQLVNNDLKPEDAWGLTFWDRNKCREKIEKVRNDGMYTAPDVGEGTLLVPGHAGGANWGGPAWDPARQWMVINLNTVAQIIRLVPREDAGSGFAVKVLESGAVRSEQAGTPYAVDAEWLLSPFGVPCSPPPWGELVAVDLAAGEVVWRSPLGSIENEAPIPLPFAWNLGQPNIGGPVITAGGVVFVGATRDLIFRAYELATGKELWRHQLDAGIAATPMTYQADGRQFVVQVTGHHLFFGSPAGDAVVAFGLLQED
ncbi:MAG: pyrroloquinoline quinone-dependent dehydrogenase [Alphaproteobacteria bacterium]